MGYFSNKLRLNFWGRSKKLTPSPKVDYLENNTFSDLYCLIIYVNIIAIYTIVETAIKAIFSKLMFPFEMSVNIIV